MRFQQRPMLRISNDDAITYIYINSIVALQKPRDIPVVFDLHILNLGGCSKKIGQGRHIDSICMFTYILNELIFQIL